MQYVFSSVPKSPSQPTFAGTANRMGGMTLELDPFSMAFVEAASQSALPVLDVGAAYGIASLAAAARGAKVFACDIADEHLAVVTERANELGVASLVTTRRAHFPDELAFDDASLGAVLAARVLHFLPGETIERGLAKLHRWLASGGRVYVVGVTPYLRKLVDFIPIYEQRVREGEAWPGWLDDVAAYDPEGARDVPRSMNLLCPVMLPRAFERAGFVVEKVELFSREGHVDHFKLDGREALGLIARKP